jgi:hypothetical protein
MWWWSHDRRVSGVQGRRRDRRGGRRCTDRPREASLGSRGCLCCGGTARLHSVTTTQPGLLLRYRCLACGESLVLVTDRSLRPLEPSE